MGKGTELWDDSALINAFDHAMAKYKAMHNVRVTENSRGNENSDGASHETILCEKADGTVQGEGNRSSNNSEDDILIDACNSFVAASDSKETHLSSDTAAEAEHQPSNVGSINENTNGYSEQQVVEYNQLVQEYYELEEQKQKVLQKLQQIVPGNEHTSVPCPGYPPEADPGYQAYAQPCCQTSCHVATPSASFCCCTACLHCCCTTQCPGAPNGTGTATATATATAGNATYPASTSQADHDAVKVGMMAAERAISSMKTAMSDTLKACDEMKKQNVESSNDGEGSENISPDPDIAVLLNAWFAAGFHTGRYLAEQSKRKG